jgi:hypothetical protein
LFERRSRHVHSPHLPSGPSGGTLPLVGSTDFPKETVVLRHVLSKAPRPAVLLSVTASVTAITMLAAPMANAAGPFQDGNPHAQSGNLLVSTSVWATDANITAGTTQLPPGCGASGDPCATAIAGGSYPSVFNNDTIDASFGVTQPIVIDDMTTSGIPVSRLSVPNSTQWGVTSKSDQMVTSFSSKSEIALNLSTDDNDVDFMGYVAPVGAIDVSNSNTPGAVDPTNPVTGSYYRAIAQLDQYGNIQFTETNAYSGNNGRAAIVDPATKSIFTAGNAGNGSNPEPEAVVTGAGSQILSASSAPEALQTPGVPTPLGNFNITQLPSTSADKSAKDDNFRGLTINNNVIYMTKGSGSNGVDTVYFVDTAGTSCPSGGVGLPSSSGTLPVAGSFASPTYSTSSAALGLTSKNPGLTPTNMCILRGFPTALAKGATDASDYPFGIWFANPTTLYVADEGAGDNTYSSTTNTYTAAAASTTAGLQKWVFDSATNQWNLAYTLQNGLNLGVPYTPRGYPSGINSATGLPWAAATDGLRNLTGHVNPNGTVNLYASTSTVSGSGDQGADPNALVSITDNVAATSLPSAERFHTLMAPTNKQVVRGVSFAPSTRRVMPCPRFGGCRPSPWTEWLASSSSGPGG